MKTPNVSLQTYCYANEIQFLLDEWEYEKNGTLTPADVSPWYKENVWWKGIKCEHSWQAVVSHRTNGKRRTSCPYCARYNRKVLVGFNDLQTTNPETANYWDFEKNNGLTPSMVVAGSGKKVWWKGECGHSFQDVIYKRVKSFGCPICWKEHATSFPEQALFFYINHAFPDAESSNKSALDGRELDIFIPSLNVGVEFDGVFWHKKGIKRDLAKNDLCSSRGITLYRIREEGCPELPQNGCKVIQCIADNEASFVIALKQLLAELGKASYDVDLDRDRTEIYSKYITLVKQNSFAAKHPEYVNLWDFEKNGLLKPDLVAPSSSKRIWWKGDCSHSWRAPVHSVSAGHGCPYCGGIAVLPGFNDLATLCPDVLALWDYDKNEKAGLSRTNHQS